MKLILTQEVTGLGAPGDVVEVKDGYGRNYLVPRGAAIRWTRGAEKTVESIKKARTSRAVRDHDTAEALKAKLEESPVQVKVRAGEGGRLFGAVTVTDIAEALAEVSGQEVDKRTIAVGNPIKSLGAHEVTVKLHDEVSATVALNVIPASD
jgi:large subunit ribosomal protein L9